MSTAGRPDADPPAADLTRQLREAAFVRLVTAATGDAVAASGLLAQALADRDTPFQVSVVALPGDARRNTDADCTVAIGRGTPGADLTLPGRDEPAVETAFEAARSLDGTTPPDPTLAFAGATAAGHVEGTRVAEAARGAGLERRPGVAVPTADIADGLAHATLLHAPFSGDVDVATGALDDLGVDPTADLDADDRRRVASLVALEATGTDDAPSRAGDAVERALRPAAGGPFETVGGYADVLDVLAREQPGTAVALALGQTSVRDAALATWRDHARRAHEALRSATTGRYDGLFVARAETDDAPVGTMARLLYAYRSPEPVALAVSADAATLVATERDLTGVLCEAAAAVDGEGAAFGQYGRARFDGDAAEFMLAVREAL